MIVISNLGHYTKVFGAIIALSLAGKTGDKSNLRFFPFSPFRPALKLLFPFF